MKQRIQGVRRGGARDRDLMMVNQFIWSTREPIIEQTLEEVIAKRGESPDRPTQVFEIGFGEGTALLEFAWKFRGRGVAFHGVDAGIGTDDEVSVRSREDLRVLPEKYEYLKDVNLDEIELPDIAFYAVGDGSRDELTSGNARGIDLPDSSIDLVYSIATIRFVTDKVRLIEEVCRILAPGGMAFLDVDDYDWDYSAEAADGTFDFEKYRGRLLLLRGARPVPIPIYFAARGGTHITFRFIPARRMMLKIVKNQDRPFNLGVRYDPKYSLAANEMPRHPNGKPIGGVRSAYQVAPKIIETMTFPWQQVEG